MKHKYEGDHETTQDYVKPAKQQEHDLCRECHRKPASVNNAVSECSHVDCPHRRSSQSLDGYTPLKVQRRGEKSGPGVPETSWGSGCMKKLPKFEE